MLASLKTLSRCLQSRCPRAAQLAAPARRRYSSAPSRNPPRPGQQGDRQPSNDAAQRLARTTRRGAEPRAQYPDYRSPRHRRTVEPSFFSALAAAGGRGGAKASPQVSRTSPDVTGDRDFQNPARSSPAQPNDTDPDPDIDAEAEADAHIGEESITPPQQQQRQAVLLSEIFQELFPPQAGRQAAPPRVERDVPRMALDVDAAQRPRGLDRDVDGMGLAGDGDGGLGGEAADKQGQERDLGEFQDLVDSEAQGAAEVTGVRADAENEEKLETRHDQKTGDGMGMLVLRGASRFLGESDFRCLVPRGKHIKGWSNQGQILKIVRGRNEATLERNGDYYLVFESKASAEAYQKRVADVHELFKQFVRRDMGSPLPPAPSSAFDASHPGSMLDSYTLRPPFGSLRLNFRSQPWAPMVRRIIEQSGYDQLTRGRLSEHEVLMSVEGVLLDARMLWNCIVSDGKQRGFFWDTVGNPHFVRFFELRQASAGNGAEEDRNNTDSHGVREEKTPEYLHRRFIVSLASRAEAQKFVTVWHRRDIKDLIENFTGERAMVNAELTW